MTRDAPGGWWYSLAKEDFNNDGSIDIVAGNLGLNHTFTTTDNKKFGVLVNDFNNDMTIDVIHTVEEENTLYPYFGKGRLGRVLAFINERYDIYDSFVDVPVSDFLDAELLNDAGTYQADSFASLLFQNRGDGTCETERLPGKAQISPIKKLLVYDVDQDDNQDLILGGNIFATNPDISRADAGNGLLMRGDGSGSFKPLAPSESGLYTPADVKDIQLITIPGGKARVVASNNGEMQMFRVQ